ncbi:MAG TPA: hypothetical protein PKI68_01030 [Pontiellaceae bacterium]|nr:hypothetical protein [Pontiellaceae bacterium]
MRKQIRDTVKEVLEKLDGFPRGSVAIGRRHKFTAAQLPSVAIYTDTEETERISMSPVKNMNTVDLVLRLDVKPDGVDLGEDKADALIAEMDSAILAGVKLIAGIFDIVQTSLNFEGDGNSDSDYLQATRTYVVRYITVG